MTAASRRECDVMVVGGGPAGIAASIASARCGAKTVLIELNDSPGGNVHHSKVHTICGLFRNDTTEPVTVHEGIPPHFANTLVQRGGADKPKQVGDVYVLPIYPDAFCELARTWLDDQPRLTLQVHTGLRTVDRCETGWNICTSSTKHEEEMHWHARLLLDTSGDAVAAEKANASCLQSSPEQLQIPSYIVELSGIPESYLHGFKKLQLHQHLAEGVKDGVLPKGCESVLLRPGPNSDTGFMTLNMPRGTRGPFDPFDESCVREFEQSARNRVERIASLLREKSDDFQDLNIVAYPQRIGVRETRRLNGRQVVDREHVLSGTSSSNAVARSAWPVELWEHYEKPEFALPESPCDLPLDSLVSETYPDLGAAGRCMSATHNALGALRVIGTAMDTGQALGITAALATSDRSLASVDPASVRERKTKLFDGTPDVFF